MWVKENSGWSVVSWVEWILWFEFSKVLSILARSVQPVSRLICQKTYANADWYPALRKLAWSEHAYPHWVLTGLISTAQP